MVNGQEYSKKIPARLKLNFNSEWKFQLGDHTGAHQTEFQDANWGDIGLPHSFSIPYFMSPDFYVGYGWYRKHFEIPASCEDKRKFLHFEGVFQEAEIYVNEQFVGKHQGGYVGFEVDITKAAKLGHNVVAIRVNNIWNPGLAPRAGEHVFSGGIYRDVHLVMTNPVHVDWTGTFVTTPIAQKDHAQVRVQTDVVNQKSKAANVRVETVIISPQGKRVAKVSSKRTIQAGAVGTVDQTTKDFINPSLWDLENPQQYTAITTLVVNGKKQDEYRTKFGVRSLKWTADSGFFLNDKHIYLLGANVHQDHAGWGDAVTNSGFVRDVQMMKDAGFNFIRGSHYPHDPAFVEACDSLGMLFWSESTFWGIGGSDNLPEGYWNTSAYPPFEKDRASFDLSNKRTLTDMIRIHRNSPSVIAWSMSNEPFFTAKSTTAAMRNLLTELVELSRSLDPTRPAAIGGAQRPLDNNRIDLLGDIAGYNGDGGVIEVFQNPGIPSIVSEYGSTTADRPGKYEPGWGDLSKIEGKAIYPWRAGQAIWCGFDHGSIAGARLGKMGIVDYFRIPKRAWYWYRNEYAKIAPPEWPKAGIATKVQVVASKKSAKADGTDDIQLMITVFDKDGKALSNSPKVTLEVISGPAQLPTGRTITFEEKSDIRILDGQAAISTRAYYSGASKLRVSSPGLQPSEIEVEFVGAKPYVEGVTPVASDKTYVRYTRPKASPVLQKFGANNPTFGSSTVPGHLTGYAADNNNQTWWQANPSDTNPWWSVDTEKKLKLHTINLFFPKSDYYQFVVETSSDNKSWTTVADFKENTARIDQKQISIKDHQVGALVRIRFQNSKVAQLSEVEITGEVVD